MMSHPLGWRGGRGRARPSSRRRSVFFLPQLAAGPACRRRRRPGGNGPRVALTAVPSWDRTPPRLRVSRVAFSRRARFPHTRPRRTRARLGETGCVHHVRCDGPGARRAGPATRRPRPDDTRLDSVVFWVLVPFVSDCWSYNVAVIGVPLFLRTRSFGR